MSTPDQRGLRIQRVNGLPEAYSGVSTVWLLSTLGGSRNINTVGIKKKDILSVSIPMTCESLLQHKSDYTLKSASSLLYGVTVCYSKKTDYVLADVNSVKTQLHRQLFESTRKSAGLVTSVNQHTIFDGVHEYRDLREFQEMQSAAAHGRRYNNAILMDDPAFDINHLNDISFLYGDKRSKGSSASLIHQRDMLDELKNGYSYETGPNVGSIEARYTNNRDYLRNPEFSSLDADLRLDFDDVLSENEMGSTKARSVNSFDQSDQDDFDLLFDREKVGNANFEELPDLDLLASDQDNDENPDNRILSQKWQERNVHTNKRRKVVRGVPDMIHLKIDESTGLGNGVLRENSDRYCAIMDSKMRVVKVQPDEASNPARWKGTLLEAEGPAFLRLCYARLLFAADADPDASSFEHGSLSVDEIERGRQKMRSLPPSRSNSSVASAERGRRMGPEILQRSGSDENMESFDLPDLQEIDEYVEPINREDVFDGVREDFMRIDLQLPPSSFGRSSSRTESGSRDQIEELRRMHSERRAHRNITLQGVEDIDESSEQHEPVDTGLRGSTQNQVLDNQSRRFFDYILERASFAGKTTKSHPPFTKKLLFEDIIPSNFRTEGYISDEANNSAPSVTRKVAANAFLSLLQLASKSCVDIDHFDPRTQFSGLSGTDILVCI
ncbi:Rec8p LALA0_S09e06458g [Lachancea lanzarotensis]|uniref:LALA0S09e06458g1_1 n=1 Tax=Lachancea lanzarotensis TaxID=1245769 RepID=A0A0C7N7U0_9SACH|nr:uncharacterized protein LALA0_S09e06458g [Lachancea lanzarotensis]CEP63963.1 LALA0S09e06458g1_1 [Lachancea lanzarotensis]